MVQFGNEFPQDIFICWVEHFWHLYETSEIRVVRGELGANSTSFHA